MNGLKSSLQTVVNPMDQSERAASVAIRTVLTSLDTINELFSLNPQTYCAKTGAVLETPDQRVADLAHLMISFPESNPPKEKEVALFANLVALSLANDVKPEVKHFLKQLVETVEKTKQTLLSAQAKL